MAFMFLCLFLYIFLSIVFIINDLWFTERIEHIFTFRKRLLPHEHGHAHGGAVLLVRVSVGFVV